MSEDHVGAESHRLEQGLTYYEHAQRLAATRFRRVNIALVAGVALLSFGSAVVSGVGGPALLSVPAAALAGAVAAMLGIVSPRDYATGFERGALECNALRLEVRQFRELLLPRMSDDAADAWISEFSARRATTLLLCPNPGQRMFKKAHKDIESGIFVYDADASPSNPVLMPTIPTASPAKVGSGA